MLEIKSMPRPAIDKLLTRIKYGHLGCSENNHPYVVPIHFGYESGFVFIFTTKGRKSEMIDANPEVCLQVEEVVDDQNWQSVMIVGDAVRITDDNERERALKSILAANPSLTPALNIRWMDPWVQEVRDVEMIYRVTPTTISGRCTAAPDASN